MKKVMKRIVAMLCVAVMIFNIAYVPKMVAEAATASETDTYKFVTVRNLNVANGGDVYRMQAGDAKVGARFVGITSWDGVIFDALLNLTGNAAFNMGGVQGTGTVQIGLQGTGLRVQVVDTKAIDITRDEIGADVVGKDTRIQVQFLYSNIDATTATADIKIKFKVGSVYENEINLTGHSTMEQASGIICGLHSNAGTLEVKSVKPDTDYRIVSVQDFTGLKEFTAIAGNTQDAEGVTSFDGVLLDGIYNFAAVGPHFNIGSGVNGLQINPVKYNNGGYYMRYQILDCSKTNRSVYGRDVSTTVLGSEVINTDIRIRVGFSYANVTTTDGVTTADVTVHIKIGESYEDIFTAYGYQITNNLIIQDVKTEVEGVLADRDNVLIAFNNVAAGAITAKSGPSADLVEITPADFGVADIDGYTNYDATHKNLVDMTSNTRFSMDKKVFSADVQFTGPADEQTCVSIGGANWNGARFGKATAENKFFFRATFKAFCRGTLYIDATKAGLDSASDAFNLKISIEFVDADFDNDDLKDDIKYGIYINDKLCAERYALSASENVIGQMFVYCHTESTTIKVATAKQKVSSNITPYILEDFGVREDKYFAGTTEVEGYFYNDISDVTAGGSSISGKVALSGDAKVSLYGKTNTSGYRIVDSYYIRNVGTDGVYAQSGSEARERLNHGGSDAVASMDGVMFDGNFIFPSGGYFTVGGGTSTVGRFQMQLNNNGLVCQLVVPSGVSMTPCTVPTSVVKVGEDVHIQLGFKYANVNMTNKTADITVQIIVNDSYAYEVTSIGQTIAPYEDVSGVIVGMGNGITVKPAPTAVVYTDKGLNFSMTDAGLVLNSTFAGMALPINIPFTDVVAGETFEFTVAEEIYDLDNDGAKDDVRFSIWVNGDMYLNKRYYVLNFANKVSTSVYISSGTTETSSAIVEPSVNIEVYDLADTENGYLLSGQGALTVNGESKANGDLIDRMGEYTIRCSERGAYVKLVVLYRTGNVHIDEDAEVVDVLDLVALKKVVAGQKTLETRVAEKSADVDGNNTINDTDSVALRNLLVGNEEVLPRRVTHEEGVMPIVGFYGPYRAEDTTKGASYDFITEDIYQMIKEVGINQISYTSNADFRLQPQAVIDSLELAEKYGIGLYVNDNRFSGALETKAYANYLKDYMKYKSFKGFFIVDEPSTSDLLDKYQIGRDMGVFADKMSLVNSFSNTMGYMNMYPKSVVGKVIGPNHIVGVDEDGVYANETSYKANRLTNIASDKITSLNNVVFDGIFNFSSNGAFGIGGHCNGAANRLQMSVVTEKGVTYFRYQLVGDASTVVSLTEDDLGCQFVDKDLRVTATFVLTNMEDDTADVTVKIKIGPTYQNTITAKNYNIKDTLVNSGGVVVGPMGKISVKALDKDAIYRNYINTCVAPGMKYLSWDYYTFDGAAKKSEYFEHLSIMRDESATRGIPFWGFVQAGSRWNDAALELPEANTDFPSASEVLWNANTTLAYGAKGIQWFPLIQPFTFAYEDSEDGYDYNRNGLIAANGEKTRWYDYAKAANQQIALVDEYLLYAENLDVLAIGSTAQNETGIKKTTYGDLLTGVTATRGALIGVFDYQGKTAFYVVNYDTSESNTGADTITLNFNTNQTWEVHSTQLAADVSATSGTSCALSLNNGGAALVILK